MEKKARFEVSTEGMRALQIGREPWQLAKELIANVWDEASLICRINIESITPRQAKLTIYDDGNGFTNIKDAWTLMGHTPKRANPTVRGRFNIGEKEILSIAISAKVRTSGKIISFPKSGGRNIRTDPNPIKGTLIECILPWGNRQVENSILKLKDLLPPDNITYTVNDEAIPYRQPTQVIDAILDTVIQEGGIDQPLITRKRKTNLELYPNEQGQLFEMGIPVQAIECPYLVNVLQKVPMPPNRDVVKDSYLQDIYTYILNATADDVAEPSATWVRQAVEDKEVEPEAVKTIMDKRYGDKVLLWSTDSRANEKAEQAGYEIIHGRTLSPTEREAMQDVGLVHTSDRFPTQWGNAPDYPEDKWSDGMRQVVEYAKSLHQALFNKPLTVSMYTMVQSDVGADYSMGLLRFNIGRLGKHWFDSIDHRTTSLLLHEFAHRNGYGHNWEYIKSLEDLAGKAVHLALDNPTIYSLNSPK